MIHTRICSLLEIRHPIVLGGMGGGATAAPLVTAVSNSGGLGVLGSSGTDGAKLRAEVEAIRRATDKPFGINHLLFEVDEERFSVTLQTKPAVASFAWARADQELRAYFDRAHAAGCKVMYMGGEVSENVRAAEAGADIIVAQGTEAGGHVGWMASMPLVPMVVDAVAPLPVLAAGGFADGRGLAAALALGAEGVLVGTRLLATHESPLHPNFKQAILDSDGHDTVLTEIPDLASGRVWPGAMSRVCRNHFIERWAGREWAVRSDQRAIAQTVAEARKQGDAANAPLFYGQDAGLIDAIRPAGEIVESMAAEAEEIIKQRLALLVKR
ncbi:MAG TPA: nitronate monooxygenase [Candidatus Binatia bacterium]|jgi:NAD(P)H-dependent flavin oxidoreductase YrpB (nitropropane dioxygenase family)